MRTARSFAAALALALPLAACASLSGSSGQLDESASASLGRVAQKIAKCSYGALIVSNGSYYDATLLSSRSGARLGEATGLIHDQVFCFRREDVDPSSGRMEFTVRPHGSAYPGRGSVEDGMGHVWSVTLSQSGSSTLVSSFPERRFATKEDMKRAREVPPNE
jgi:hypothetical protein